MKDENNPRNKLKELASEINIKEKSESENTDSTDLSPPGKAGYKIGVKKFIFYLSLSILIFLLAVIVILFIMRYS